MQVTPSFERVYGIADAVDRIDMAGRFLDAFTPADYEALNDEYPNLFGKTANGQKPADVESICKLMRRAVELFGLAYSDDDASFDDMLMLGLRPMAYTDTGGFYLFFTYEVEGECYRSWLEHAYGSVRGRFRLTSQSMRFDTCSGMLSTNAGWRPRAYKGFVGQCKYILEQLIDLHLADVATVCGDAARPAQMAYSGISCLWLGLAERLSGGRAYRCETCGKPCVAYDERRRSRHCSSQCRKWANKHPGEKRGRWYYGPDGERR